jgi:hypothetical protein
MPDLVDAADIADTALLLRRIDARMLDRTAKELQSWAWSDQEDEVSVYVAAETTEEKVLLLGKPGQIVIRIAAGDLRRLGYIVVRDPEPDESSHCIIHPYPSSRTQRKDLCRRSSWD